MKNILLFSIAIIFLFSCKTDNIQGDFKIIGLRHHYDTNTDDKLFEITSSDIICVDWRNQSFMISPKVIKQIKDENRFTGGFINEYLQVKFNDQILTSVNIHNSGSSTRYFVKNSPSAYIFSSTNTIFNSEGWLIINPFHNNENSLYSVLYSDSVFCFFKNRALLTGRFWNCHSNLPKDSLVNLPNRNFGGDLKSRFDKEVFY